MRVYIRIRGRVQGVGFRWAAQRQALALGLIGWVRNHDDGSVESVADGDDSQVHAFIRWCHNGPRSADVSQVEVQGVVLDETFADFSIRF